MVWFFEVALAFSIVVNESTPIRKALGRSVVTPSSIFPRVSSFSLCPSTQRPTFLKNSYFKVIYKPKSCLIKAILGISALLSTFRCAELQHVLYLVSLGPLRRTHTTQPTLAASPGGTASLGMSMWKEPENH